MARHFSGKNFMEARVTSIGGIIQLDSSPDQGTTITAHIPMPGEANG